MSLLDVLVLVIIVTIVVTMTLAVVSYGAFKIRERRRPLPEPVERAGPLFFERVRVTPRAESEV